MYTFTKLRNKLIFCTNNNLIEELVEERESVVQETMNNSKVYILI